MPLIQVYRRRYKNLPTFFIAAYIVSNCRLSFISKMQSWSNKNSSWVREINCNFAKKPDLVGKPPTPMLQCVAGWLMTLNRRWHGNGIIPHLAFIINTVQLLHARLAAVEWLYQHCSIAMRSLCVCVCVYIQLSLRLFIQTGVRCVPRKYAHESAGRNQNCNYTNRLAVSWRKQKQIFVTRNKQNN